MSTDLSQVSDCLASRLTSFSNHAFEQFFQACPLARTRIHSNVHLAHMVVRWLRDPNSVDAIDLATRAVIHGLEIQEIRPATEAILDAMWHTCAELDFSTVLEAERGIRAISKALLHNIGKTSIDTQRALGTVVQVQRCSRRIQLVRIEAGQLPKYAPGEKLSVSTPHSGGAWTYYPPSIPWNPQGQVEFQVLHDFSQASSFPVKEGDQWVIGPAVTQEQSWLSSDNDLLLISEGVGLAATKAIMLHHFMQGTTKRMHMFIQAPTPGEQYELRNLWHLAASAPWLAVTPVVESRHDQWWTGATEYSQAPRGLHLTQVGYVGDIVASYGSWADRDVVIASPNPEAIAQRLQQAGTPREHMQLIQVGETEL